MGTCRQSWCGLATNGSSCMSTSGMCLCIYESVATVLRQPCVYSHDEKAQDSLVFTGNSARHHVLSADDPRD
jgi:hypothetical protein